MRVLIALNAAFCYSAEHVSTMVSMHGEFVEKEGERYLHVNAFNADVSMDNMKVIATGIFPEPELSKAHLQPTRTILHRAFMSIR